MNVRQRHFLVASLRSLSIILTAVCLALVASNWYSAAFAPLAQQRVSTPWLPVLLLSAGASLWLGHFLKLGEDLHSHTHGVSREPVPPKISEGCPSWPTILSWLVTDLRDEDAQRVSTHVSGCENCRKRLALMNAVQEMASDRRQ